jgi:flavin reductase (DIM6/NTAB) family NADH-FMN oxidoreductase RutF
MNREPGDAMSDAPRNRSQGGITSRTGERSRSRMGDLPVEGIPADASAMRAARRRWSSGVAILTTAQPGDEGLRLRGATISGFLPLSLDPPLIAVAVEANGTMARLIQETGICAVSVLDRAHGFEADRFAGLAPVPNARFDGIPHSIAETGSPVLTGALAWFDCRLTQAIPTGDHLLLICDVVRIGLGADTDDPLLNYEGAYRRIEG